MTLLFARHPIRHLRLEPLFRAPRGHVSGRLGQVASVWDEPDRLGPLPCRNRVRGPTKACIEADMWTDAQIRTAEPAETAEAILRDGGLCLDDYSAGLFLRRAGDDTGGAGKPASLDTDPDLPLARARPARKAARLILCAGSEPGIAGTPACRASGGQGTRPFEMVSRRGFALRRSTRAPAWAGTVVQSLEGDVPLSMDDDGMHEPPAPAMRTLPSDIALRQALGTARRIRQRGTPAVVCIAASGRWDARR